MIEFIKHSVKYKNHYQRFIWINQNVKQFSQNDSKVKQQQEISNQQKHSDNKQQLKEENEFRSKIKEILQDQKKIKLNDQRHDLLKQNLELVRLRNELSKQNKPQLKKKSELKWFDKIIGFVKHAIHETKEGTIKCIQDYKFTKNLIFNKSIHKQEEQSVFELQEISRIKFDFLKLIPFSFFLVIPLSEILIPPYIFLFPNAFPSQYIPKETALRNERIKKYSQEIAYNHLIIQLKSVLIHQGVPLKEMQSQQQMLKLVIENKEIIEEQLNLYSLDSDTLLEISSYLSIDLIKGTHILNQIFKHTLNLPRYIINLIFYLFQLKHRVQFKHWIFNHEIKCNFWFFENIKKSLLRTQINRQQQKNIYNYDKNKNYNNNYDNNNKNNENNIRAIQNMRVQDHSMAKFGIPKDSKHDNNLFKIGIQRGFNVKDSQDLREVLMNHWINKTSNVQITNSQYIWFALLNYNVNPKISKYL